MKQLKTFLLENNQGMSVEIMNYGARITSILFPVNGKSTEMTVGYASSEDYLTDDFYFGVTCGRVCNRIEQGKFELNGVYYQITQNDGEQSLHGGLDNFSTRFWQVNSSTKSSVTLSIESLDGDQGFPGKLNLQVTYQLTDNNQIEIDYFATTDAPTPINITNHAYFNLGEGNGQLLDVKIAASSMLERKDNGVPSGKLLPVENTDFDFRQLTNIGERQENTTDINIQEMACFDHCFVLDNTDITKPKAELVSKNNKVKMTVLTNQPAVQFYTGVALSGEFSAYQGVCLESQDYSNAVNIDHFPNTILTPDAEYNRKIIYQFDSL